MTGMPDPLPAKFDPAAAWDALSPAEQRRIGAAALVFAYARAALGHAPLLTGMIAAEQAAERVLDDALPAILLPAAHLLRGEPAPLPDLAPLGVRACLACGCTEECGCLGGCDWVGPALCSRCAATEAAEEER